MKENFKETDAKGAQDRSPDSDRRQFLEALGKFSFATPPAITLLLSTSLTSKAIAKSGAGGSDGRDKDGDDSHGHGHGLLHDLFD